MLTITIDGKNLAAYKIAFLVFVLKIITKRGRFPEQEFNFHKSR